MIDQLSFIDEKQEVKTTVEDALGIIGSAMGSDRQANIEKMIAKVLKSNR